MENSLEVLALWIALNALARVLLTNPVNPSFNINYVCPAVFPILHCGFSLNYRCGSLLECNRWNSFVRGFICVCAAGGGSHSILVAGIMPTCPLPGFWAWWWRIRGHHPCSHERPEKRDLFQMHIIFIKICFILARVAILRRCVIPWYTVFIDSQSLFFL